MPTLDRWSILAGARFFLALVVVVTHLSLHAKLGPLVVLHRAGAFEAILGFLLISGYSIGSSYAKQPEGFLWRRIARLYPVYFGAMLLTFAVSPQPVTAHLLATIGANALFLNQIVTKQSYVGPAWSLALEFWLYLLTPLLMTLTVPRLRVLTWASFVLFLIYTCGRTVLDLPYYSFVAFGLNLLFLSYAWLAGLQLSRRDASAPQVLRDVKWIFAGHLLLFIAIQFAMRVKNRDIPAFFSADLFDIAPKCLLLLGVYLVFRHIIAASQRDWNEKPKPRPSKVLRFLGDISYPLYLVHLPTFLFLESRGYTNALIYLACALGMSIAFYLVLDFYSKKRESRSQTPQPQETPTATIPAASGKTTP